MTPSPQLSVDRPDGSAQAIALVLHGGRSTGEQPVRPTQVAVLRMQPFAAALRRSGRARGLAVARLRYAVRGWNGAQHSPVGDVHWALDQLGERFPGRPVALVGHSMGGRAALWAAGHPGVVSVVGLAPWIEPADPIEPLTGRRVMLLHGSRDRMTSPSASAEYAVQARAVATTISYVSVTGDRHAMLRRARLWHELAAGFALATLLGVDERHPNPGAPGDWPAVLAQALAGTHSLVV